MRYLGLVALLAFPLGIVGIALSGLPNADTPEEIRTGIEERGYGLGLASIMFATTGLTIALYFTWLAKHYEMPNWTNPIAIIWGGVWVLAGFLMFAIAEIGGHENNPEGAGLIGVMVYLLMLNPIAAALGGLIAIGFWHSNGPRRLRRFSLGLGVVAVVLALFGSIGGIGLLGLGPCVVWWLTISVWTALRPRTSQAATDAAPA